MTSLNASGKVAKTPEQSQADDQRGKTEKIVKNHSEEQEVTSELELTQEINDERTIPATDQRRTSFGVSDKRSGSPFANGRTEVLIGQDGGTALRTAAVVEHNRLSVEEAEVQLR